MPSEPTCVPSRWVINYMCAVAITLPLCICLLVGLDTQVPWQLVMCSCAIALSALGFCLKTK